MSFRDRQEAGRRLAAELARLDIAKPLVLALPRGGVPVAAEVAKVLRAPLDLLLVGKIGVPWQPELAAAAVVDGDHHEVVLNDGVMMAVGLYRHDIEKLVPKHLCEIERRRHLYLGSRKPYPVKGSTAIIVDDGIATGTTVRAALKAVRRRKPAQIILAVPVAAPEMVQELASEADVVVCLEQPAHLFAVGSFYSDFGQVEDDQVISTLAAVDSATFARRVQPKK